MTGGDGRRLGMLLALARAAVFWERIWPRVWPGLVLAGLFVALALLDVLPSLPAWLHAAVLAGFAVGGLVAIFYARPGFRAVDRQTALRRLERDSALGHRPLSAVEDRLAAGRGDDLAEALWQRHRQKMASLLAGLRLRWPFADLARHEPWGIRAGVILLLAVALVAGAAEAPQRFQRAFSPGLSFEPAAARSFELWITPPAYTRQAPLFLSNATGGGVAKDAPPLSVLAGSTVLARAGGVGRAPSLQIGEARVEFQALDATGGEPAAFRAEAVVDGGEHLTILDRGRALARWPIRVIPDRPPAIAFAEPPSASGNGLLSLAFQANDDYGVTAVTAFIRPDGQPPSAGPELSLPLPAASAEPTAVAGGGLHDLASHRWAGTPVQVQLEAVDAAGQTGRSTPAQMILPERQFTHPVARAMIAERKRLSLDATTRATIAASLTALAARPDDYRGDVVVTLALAVARSRLVYDDRDAAIDQVRDLLWDTAMRLEEGDVPLAERELAEKRQRLLDALARNAPDAEIDRAIDEMREALDRLLSAVAAELQRRGDAGPPIDPQATVLHGQDLQDLLEMARQLARAGARDSAQQLLAEMQRMLDGLRAGLSMRSPSSQAMAEARALMQALRELKDRQQDLLEQTFERLRAQRERQERQERNGPPAAAGRPAPGSAEQGQLRKDLGALLAPLQQNLGGLPKPLAEADQSMRSAGRSLDAGRLGEALTGQGAAVDALDRALDAVGEALSQQLGGGLGLSGGGGGGRGDPFGRRPAGGQRGIGDERVRIPDQSEMRRVGEILNELRRRAGDPDRPITERQYIERLLRRF